MQDSFEHKPAADLRSLLLTPSTTSQPSTSLSATTPSSQTTQLGTGTTDPSHDPLRKMMASALGLEFPCDGDQQHSPPASQVIEIPSAFNSILPALTSLRKHLLEELLANSKALSALNRSRREAISVYLQELAEIPQPHPASREISYWLDPHRNNKEKTALRTFFDETALLTIGKALLLKVWSDRGIRTFKHSDLMELNWALTSTLRTFTPLDREGWQVSRSNLYSWYIPSPQIQQELWNQLQVWRFTNEGPDFIVRLMLSHRTTPTTRPCGYDSRFYKSLWESATRFGFLSNAESNAIPRRKFVFSPTLREGGMIRGSQSQVFHHELEWMGSETSLFLLMVAELGQLWWGPSTAPLWMNGNSLDSHPREQLSLALPTSHPLQTLTRPTTAQRLAEIEAFDIAFVMEEFIIRSQGKSPASGRFREQIESLPFYKKLKKSGTTLGNLQACLSLNKLRSGGLLFWAREEALSTHDGEEMLNYLLDRGKLICEWDFTRVEHSLPHTLPLIPKHLYLFQRESQLDARHSHRPKRVSVRGTLRSHVELPLLLEDALHSSSESISFRGAWVAQTHTSPLIQKEWTERWPDPASNEVMLRLDRLKQTSQPLATLATVLETPRTPASSAGWQVDPALKGIWIESKFEGEKRKLKVRLLPAANETAQGQGFMILLADDVWIAPLRVYLTSKIIHDWLEQHAERKSNRWCLNEQTLRFIPIPRSLIIALGLRSEGTHFAKPLPGEWERLLSGVRQNPVQGPMQLKEAIRNLSQDLNPDNPPHAVIDLQATLYTRISRILDQVYLSKNRLSPFVNKEAQINWKALLAVLPPTELTTLSLHPEVTLQGQLPPQIPIGRIDRLKAAQATILLCTDSGHLLQIQSANSILLEMIWSQIEGKINHTWSELLQYVQIPRKADIAQVAANDILRCYLEEAALAQELHSILSHCQLF